MLRQRIITALILIPLVIGGILWLPSAQLGLALGLFVLIGAWEWSALIGIEHWSRRLAYVGLLASLLFNIFFLLEQAWAMLPVLLVAVVWWLWGWRAIVDYVGALGVERAALFRNLLVGVVVLVPSWAALLLLHSQPERGPALLILLLVLIWAADSGAYFAGREFGKRKLAPLVSPGKTWEGVMGALLAVSLVALVGGRLLELDGWRYWGFFVLCWITTVFSIEGDLMESLYKRRAQVKDSGVIFPGHGGVLDRIDSLTAAAPVFTVGLWSLGVLG